LQYIYYQDEPDLILPNIVSFVAQLDNHAPYLTVKETFDFAFQCRTGGTHSNLHAAGEVDTTSNDLSGNLDNNNFTENLTIEGLDLAHVANTFVGNDDVRGISGGQRRRVTVGEMMQGQNPVACADEISTGLDAAVTYDIVHSIVDFSKKAMTTRIISLLQPGPETVSLFDEIVMLAEGQVVFAGPIEEVLEYFSALGYHQPATMDVADYIQSIPTPDGALFFDPETSPYDSHMPVEQLASIFLESPQHQRIQDKIRNNVNPNMWKPTKSATKKSTSSSFKPKSSQKMDEEAVYELTANAKPVPNQFKILYQNSFGRAMMLNCKRHFTLWYRDWGFIIGKMFENIGMAVATGGILFGQAKISKDGIETFQDIFTNENQQQAYEESQKTQKVLAAIYGALFMTTFHILLGEFVGDFNWPGSTR